MRCIHPTPFKIHSINHFLLIRLFFCSHLFKEKLKKKSAHDNDDGDDEEKNHIQAFTQNGQKILIFLHLLLKIDTDLACLFVLGISHFFSSRVYLFLHVHTHIRTIHDTFWLAEKSFSSINKYFTSHCFTEYATLLNNFVRCLAVCLSHHTQIDHNFHISDHN